MKYTTLMPAIGLLWLLPVAGCQTPTSQETLAMSKTSPGPDSADAQTEFTQTPSGLKYRILRSSDGSKPAASDTVLCNYKGWLDDGSEFDSSYQRGAPIDFPLRGVIAGWTEGLQLIGEGGKIELEIPHDLGYGARGMPPTIPPAATLHFIVELEQIM